MGRWPRLASPRLAATDGPPKCFHCPGRPAPPRAAVPRGAPCVCHLTSMRGQPARPADERHTDLLGLALLCRCALCALCAHSRKRGLGGNE